MYNVSLISEDLPQTIIFSLVEQSFGKVSKRMSWIKMSVMIEQPATDEEGTILQDETTTQTFELGWIPNIYGKLIYGNHDDWIDFFAVCLFLVTFFFFNNYFNGFVVS
jgi:hypothetical protein